MELRDYLELIGRHRWLVTGVTALATAVVMGLTANQPTHYEGSVTMSVYQETPTAAGPATAYDFDSFYTIQAAGLYADQLKARVTDPSFVATVFEGAHVTLPTTRLSQIGRVLTARKLNPSAVQVTFTDTDRDRVAAVLNQAMTSLRSETAELQADGTLTSMRLRASLPLVFAYEASGIAAGALAAAVTFLLMVAFIFLAESAKPRTGRS